MKLAKEKAEYLISIHSLTMLGEIGNKNFYEVKQIAKQCALIAVDNAMDALGCLPYGLDYFQQIYYWEEVKQE